MSFSLRASLYALSVVAFLALPEAYAQTETSGDLAGVVKDTTDAVIANATITITSIAEGNTRSMTSNDSGAFRFTFLKPGEYTISAQTPGLKTDLVKVAVQVGQVTAVDLIAKVQATQEVVEVASAAASVETENANLTTTLTSKQVLDLPAPGGDITTVAFTVPGIVVSTGSGYGNFSSHGLPGVSNLFTTNGNDNMDPYLNLNNSGASNLTLGQNEVQEAAVVQNGYSVQYGRQAGAQLNFTTKSGSNAYHGNLLYNWNGDTLNANDFFNNANGVQRPRAVSNQYAASIGGPVMKDKLFFYADTEGLRYTLPSSFSVAIPSPQFQNYVLSTLPSSQLAFYKQAFGLYNGAPGANNAVPVSNGVGNLQDSTGALGCGGFAGTPAGNGGTFGVNTPCAYAFGTNGANHNQEWLLVTRADWNVNDHHKVDFRFKTDHGSQPTGTDPINPLFNTLSVQPEYEGQATWTWVITPSVVNNFIGSASWYSALFGPANLQATLAAFPTYLDFFDGGTNGAGAITALGLNSLSFPQGRNVGQGQIADDFSIVKGNHTIKLGANFRYNKVKDTGYLTRQSGIYEFFDLADFAAGQVVGGNGDVYSQAHAVAQAAHLTLYSLGVYAQDEWSAKPNLKLTVGVRIDNNSNPTCESDCFVRLTDAFSQLDFQKGVTIPYNQSILTGLSRAYKSLQPIVVQPRFGVVWSPLGANKAVIRGGIGLFSDLAPGFLASSIFRNAPNYFAPSVRFGAVDFASDPNSGGAISDATNTAFQNGFASGYTLAQIQQALAPVRFTPPAFFTPSNDMKNPQYLEWSFEVQQPIGSKNVLAVTYSGNHGIDLLLRNLKVNASAASGFGGLPLIAPDPRFRIVTRLNNAGTSNYDGLSVQFRRSFSYGFQGQIGYTYSHALDDVSNGGTTLVYSGDSLSSLNAPTGTSLNYSNADYDIRHNLTADFIWDLPFRFSSRAMKATFGGWTLSGKFFWRTGTPFSVYNTSLPGVLSPTIGGNILSAITDPHISQNCGPSAVNTPCFTPAQFETTDTQTDWGNVPRNFFRGPHYADVDMSLYKNFAITEHMAFTLGASAYNLANHPNFASPGQNPNVGGLGLITSTVIPPTSAYGSFQGSAVSGRVLVVTGRFSF